MDWLLERALICDRMGWTRLPDELDESSIELVQAFQFLDTFRAYQTANEDLEKLSKRGLEIYAAVQELRQKAESSSDNKD